ncbi:hypothetical protein [Desulfovibrio litoralis]|uniref:Uncharacterized protein n=1 Tax=Desulfovibrio litoralis DSM 11393 TaxID=1121455 RepID=A0A1M7T2P1_9BACT|nr:hypothetical protein [Desulfovibrio litoralis]SHN64969.1 hypothetical protein SAMN02745728_01479 [Desulfovibrio litoralis DSM 11393]
MLFGVVLDYVIGYFVIAIMAILIVLIIRDRHSYKWWQYIVSLLCSIVFVVVFFIAFLEMVNRFFAGYDHASLPIMIRSPYWGVIYFACVQTLFSYIMGKYILKNTFKNLFYRVHAIVALCLFFEPTVAKVVKQIIGYFSQ